MNQVIQVIKEQVQNFNLIVRLAVYDAKSKYQMHYFGIIWQFLNPTVQIFIYWLVFGLGIRGGRPINNIPYFAWLICGLIPWFFINPTITQGSNSVFSKLNLVSKMKFPVSILPSITIIGNSLNFSMMLVVLILILFINGISPNIYFIQIIYYLICLYAFLFSVTLFFSTFSTIVRDFQSLLQALMKMLFYINPIIWDFSTLPGNLQTILKLNPICYLIFGFRNSFLYKKWFFDDIAYTIYFWTVTFIILFIGAALHLKLRKKFVDYL